MSQTNPQFQKTAQKNKHTSVTATSQGEMHYLQHFFNIGKLPLFAPAYSQSAWLEIIPAVNKNIREFITLLTKMLRKTPYVATLKKVKCNSLSRHFGFWQTNQLTDRQTDTGENSITLVEVIIRMWQMIRRQLRNLRTWVPSLFDLAFLGMFFLVWL